MATQICSKPTMVAFALQNSRHIRPVLALLVPLFLPLYIWVSGSEPSQSCLWRHIYTCIYHSTDRRQCALRANVKPARYKFNGRTFSENFVADSNSTNACFLSTYGQLNHSRSPKMLSIALAIYVWYACIGPFVSSEEVVTRLVQVGLFDKAVDTALHFDLPMDSIFEALASRYVYVIVRTCTCVVLRVK